MDACFFSACLQLVKKPPDATQCARTCQFVYETSKAKRILNTARTCTVQREKHNEHSDKNTNTATTTRN